MQTWGYFNVNLGFCRCLCPHKRHSLRTQTTARFTKKIQVIFRKKPKNILPKPFPKPKKDFLKQYSKKGKNPFLRNFLV